MLMNKRILTIANLINDNSIIIDVGCDHAYLSLILFKQKKIKFAYNIDINYKPLENGRKNLLLNEFTNNYEFILNDGLKKCYLNVDYVIISGMGSKNIIDIIKNSDSKTKYYILQPNNNIHLLRIFLKENNAKILKEVLVWESNIYYEILLVEFNNSTNIMSDLDIYIGPVFKLSEELEFKKYINKRIDYLNSIMNDKINKNLKNEIKILHEFMVK